MESMTQCDTIGTQGRTASASLWLSLAIAVAGCDCGGSGDRSFDDVPADAAILGDGAVPDGPDPTSECAPSGTPGAFRCPARCVEWTVRVVDVASECTTSEQLIGACFPEDADVFGNGEATCFTHPAVDGLVIWSPSSQVGVSGGPDDILEEAGWVPCSETNKVRYEGFCE